MPTALDGETEPREWRALRSLLQALPVEPAPIELDWLASSAKSTSSAKPAAVSLARLQKSSERGRIGSTCVTGALVALAVLAGLLDGSLPQSWSGRSSRFGRSEVISASFVPAPHQLELLVFDVHSASIQASEFRGQIQQAASRAGLDSQESSVAAEFERPTHLDEAEDSASDTEVAVLLPSEQGISRLLDELQTAGINLRRSARNDSREVEMDISDRLRLSMEVPTASEQFFGELIVIRHSRNGQSHIAFQPLPDQSDTLEPATGRDRSLPELAQNDAAASNDRAGALIDHPEREPLTGLLVVFRLVATAG